MSTERRLAVLLFLTSALVPACGQHETGAYPPPKDTTGGTSTQPGTGGDTGTGTAGSGTGAAGTGASATGGTAPGGGGSGGSGGLGDAPGEILDPGTIYVHGTLIAGTCDREVISKVTNTNTATTGFSCGVSATDSWIRPTDGRLIWLNYNDDTVREFHCDNCKYNGGYNQKPLENDIVIPTPCPMGLEGFQPDFLVGPDGAIYHTCDLNDKIWYDSAANTVFDGGALLYIGYGKTALAEIALGDIRIVDLTGGLDTPVVGIPIAKPLVTARAISPSGFNVIIDPGSIDDLGKEEIYNIAGDGTATLLGAYPPLPAETKAFALTAKIDEAGVLYERGNTWAGDEIIFKRELGGATVIIYDGTTDPLVNVTGFSALFTGP